MSAPGSLANTDSIANASRGWRFEPASVACGTGVSGLSAALWTSKAAGQTEVQSDPDPNQHILATFQSTFWAELAVDDQARYRGIHRPGMVNLVQAGTRPRGVIRGPFRMLHLYVPDALIQRMATEAGHAGVVELIDPMCAYDRTLERIGQDVLAEMPGSQPLTRLRIDALGQDLAIQLLRHHSNLADTAALSREPGKGGLAPWQVKRVTEYLEDHLADDVSLGDLSHLLDLSTFHLCRAFKQSTGLPPHRWRQQRRMERARELLEDTDLPVTEIAASVSYDDPGQFATAFRKVVGVSPSQYRRERRR